MPVPPSNHPRHSGTRGRALLLGLILALAPQLQADGLALPDMGATADAAMTKAQEQRLGRAFMRSVRRSLPVVDDPLLTEYIEGLGRRLAGLTDRGGHSFDFFLIDQPVVNAFAGPAGHIGVYTGLILATESESELASVVAHEIAHVTQDHLLRTFENTKEMSLPMAGLLLAAIVLGAAVDSDVGMAAAAGVQAGLIQHQINFTRENEKEADRVGIQILARADFDPHAMPVFFERLSKASRLYENNAPEFLRTHPVTTNRIADAMGRADAYPYRQRPNDPSYFLVRATLRERSFDNPRDAVTHFAGTLKERRFRDEAAERYGYALALLRDHQHAAARAEIDKLLERSPSNIAYLLLAARTDQGAGRMKQAIATVTTALELFPGNYPLTDYYAELMLQAGQPASAEKALEQAMERRPDEPVLYRLRSRVAAAAGHTADAHLYLSEAHYLNGRLENAVQQLEAALRTERLDDYDASRIQARLSRFKVELKEEKKAKEKEKG